MKRQENDKKDTERKKAQPNYKNIFMHLMDETPDIIEKITEEAKNENEINDHTKSCKNKRDMKRQENDKKDAERKKAHPNYRNIYMHLMDETPDIAYRTEQNRPKKKRK